MPPSPRAAGALLIAALSLTAAAPAAAAPGAPPPPIPQHVIGGVHADVVSPLLEQSGGQPVLELASRADIDGQTGKRLDPATALFHVEDDVKLTTPGTPFEFLGPAGSPVWVSPESRQGNELWPGFSTDAIAPGALDGNHLDLSLDAVSGPGSFHLYTVDLSGPRQLLTVGGTPWRMTAGQHAHANWAFSAPGRYRLTFSAKAAVGGTPVADSETYSFHVSALPAPATTATTLTADPARVAIGREVTLAARVQPQTAEGYVEFLDGTTSLGHTAVESGAATLKTTDLPLGSRSITARFTPKTKGTATASTSEEQRIDVTAEPGGASFEITGVTPSYAAGDTLTATVGGWSLGTGQSYRWVIRKDAQDTAYVVTDPPGGTAATGTLVRELTTAYDGYEIQATLRGPGPTGSTTTLQRTSWVKINVTGPDRGSGQPITVTGLPGGPVYAGDPLKLTAAADLSDGQTLAWVQRYARLNTDWSDADPEEIRLEGGAAVRIPTLYNLEREWAAQIRRADGTIAGQSAPVRVSITPRELQLEGLRGLYRAGDTLRANAVLYPTLDGAKYRWALDYEPIPGADGTSLELPVTADLDGKTLTLEVYTDRGFEEWYSTAAYTSHRLAVTDAPPGTQVIAFDALAGHYHQGGNIALRLNADPAATQTDTVRWEWKRKGDQSYLPLPGASGFAHSLRAEQGLDGTAVRATLLTADGEELATAAPVGIYVDDHGAAPQQKVTITGKADGYRAGDDIKLGAAVNPATVLNHYRWTIQRPGQTEPRTIEGHTGPTLTSQATLDDHGAAIRVAVTHADGTTAYGPSEPVTLNVTAADVTDPPAEEPQPTTPAGDGLPSANGERPTASAGSHTTPPRQSNAAANAPLTETQLPILTQLAARKRVPAGKRSVVVAHLTCPSVTACSVKVPRTARVTIAGKRHKLQIKTSKIQGTGRSRLQVVFTPKAKRQLKNRTTQVRFKAAATTGSRTRTSTINITLVG